MKYINISNMGLITFPDTIDHLAMFTRLVPDGDRTRIIGAGKIGGDNEIVPNDLYCYGESITLGVRCDKSIDNAELKRSITLF